MDDRTRQMIEYYLPNQPDPTLGQQEYYYLQYTKAGSQVIRVFALDILPHKDGVEYGIYRQHGTHLQKVSVYDDPFRGARMSDLYDNWQDCHDQSHMMCEEWEELRELQRQEANQ